MSRRDRAVLVAVLVALLLLGWALVPGPDDPSAEPDPAPPAPRVGQGQAAPSPSAHPGEREVPAPPGTTPRPSVASGDPSPLTDEALAELAAELAADPRTHVVCDVGLEVRHAEGYLAIGEPSGFNGRRVTVVNGKAYLPLVYDLGDMGSATFSERSGTFSLEGYGPQRIAWTDRPEGGPGSCTAPIDPEPGRASLTGTLTLRPSGAPAAGGWIEGCGNMAFADQHGVVHMDIVPEPCTLLAMRQDGLLRTMSEPVAIVPQRGRDVVVDIEIPEAPRGGLGVQVSVDEAGRIMIDGLLPTGPAGEAGLLAGDVVLTVDGDPTADMSLEEFVRLVGGEAGSTVTVTVDREGEQLSFDVVREVLSAG